MNFTSNGQRIIAFVMLKRLSVYGISVIIWKTAVWTSNWVVINYRAGNNYRMRSPLQNSCQTTAGLMVLYCYYPPLMIICPTSGYGCNLVSSRDLRNTASIKTFNAFPSSVCNNILNSNQIPIYSSQNSSSACENNPMVNQGVLKLPG